MYIITYIYKIVNTLKHLIKIFYFFVGTLSNVFSSKRQNNFCYYFVTIEK